MGSSPTVGTMNKLCLSCGLPVKEKRFSFCSRKCSNSSRPSNVGNCEVCGKKNKLSRNRFCSRNCASSVRKRIKKCLVCGSNINSTRRKFCSDYCARRKLPLESLLKNNSRGQIKKRLLQDCILENVCSECGLRDYWNDKPIVMHLDHINGVNNDNRIVNLRMLCPNCHSQQETYAGRNARKKGNMV